jgi:hypothetical protein
MKISRKQVILNSNKQVILNSNNQVSLSNKVVGPEECSRRKKLNPREKESTKKRNEQHTL